MPGIIQTSGILDIPSSDISAEAEPHRAVEAVGVSEDGWQSLTVRPEEYDSSRSQTLNTEQPAEYSVVLDSQAAQQPVPKIKRGDTLSVMNCEEGMTVVTGKVIAVATLPYPNDYTLALVHCDRKFIVAIHKSDWLRMADGVRSVENEAMTTVESYLRDKQTNYLSVASGKFGGKGGFSAEYAANKLWKKVSGERLGSNFLLI